MSETVKHILFTVIAVVVTAGLTWFATSFNEGTAAVDDAHIKKIAEGVVLKEMKLDTGMTQAQAIAQINLILARWDGKFEGFDQDVDDLRDAVRALARQQ